MQRTDVGTVCVDEVEDHDLVPEIGKPHRAPFGVLQFESRRVLVDRLEVPLALAELTLEFLQRVRSHGRRHRSRKRKADGAGKEYEAWVIETSGYYSFKHPKISRIYVTSKPPYYLGTQNVNLDTEQERAWGDKEKLVRQ